MRRIPGVFVALTLLIGTAAWSVAAHAAEVTVLAAASLTDALGQIDADFEKASGHKVKAAFGGSSALAKQLEKGAPADLFISADVPWMDYVAKAKLIDDGSRSNLLGNHLVLVGPASATETVTIDKNYDLAGALKGGKLSTPARSRPANTPRPRWRSSGFGRRSKAAWPRPRTCARHWRWSSAAKRRSASSTRPMRRSRRSRSSAPSPTTAIRRSSIRWR
jgi:hypothetical protein